MAEYDEKDKENPDCGKRDFAWVSLRRYSCYISSELVQQF